jgi:hypothetical protein
VNFLLSVNFSVFFARVLGIAAIMLAVVFSLTTCDDTPATGGGVPAYYGT